MMPTWIRSGVSYLCANWERILFGLVGAACLVLTFRALLQNQVPTGAALFGMAFFSFFYANLARFKKFKGLGFEAELWEDKQKEAADLIDRLKSIVSTYTREIVMENVMRGRFTSGETWVKRWQLFDELSGKHFELGQEIDFSDLKRDMDSVFIFDICLPLSESIRNTIDVARSDMVKNIEEKYGSPVRDIESITREIARLNAMQFSFDDLFERAKSENIARLILDTAASAKTRVREDFCVVLDYKTDVIERLEAMVRFIANRPIAVTPQLIEWSQWRDNI